MTVCPGIQTGLEGRIDVGPNVLLAASLLLGQTPEVDDFTSSVRTYAWTNMKTFSKTSTHTWSSTGGWVTTSGSWREERPGSGRFLDKIGGLFGRRGGSGLQGWRSGPKSMLTEEDDPSLAENPAVTLAPALDEDPEITPAIVAPTVTAPPLAGPARIGPGLAGPRLASPAMTLAPLPVGPAPARIALTPGGDITIEAETEPAGPQGVKPAAFEPPARPGPAIHPKFAARLAHAEDYSWIIGQLRIEKGVYELHYTTSGRPDRLGGVLVLEMKGDLSPLRNGDLLHAQGRLYAAPGRQPVYRPSVIQILERQ